MAMKGRIRRRNSAAAAKPSPCAGLFALSAGVIYLCPAPKPRMTGEIYHLPSPHQPPDSDTYHLPARAKLKKALGSPL